MDYLSLIERTVDLPFVETSALRAWGEDPRLVSVQVSRWVRAGKLVQLRRGLYMLPRALRRTTVPVEYVANALVTPSYVSLQRALAIYGMIPERVPLIQSVTTARAGRFSTPEARFDYRHVKSDWFCGYVERPFASGSALVATPEKALLDLVWLSPGRFTRARVEELRLQETHQVDIERLIDLAAGRGPRLEEAAHLLSCEIQRERR